MKLKIENLGWHHKRYKALEKTLIPLIKKISKFLKLKNDIIIHLYQNSDKDDDRRAQYDEGVIILFEKTPDPRGDVIHEFGHQLYRPENMSITVKVRLQKLKRKLDKNKGDGRIFIQEHTYSDILEVWSTIFKWYILGKVVDKSYLGVLNNFQPEAVKIVEDILTKEKLIKSEKEIKSEIIENLLKSLSDEGQDNKTVKQIEGIVLEKIKKYKLEKSQNKLYIDLVVNEIMGRKTNGRYNDLITILDNKYPENKLDKIGLNNPIGISDINDFSSFIKSSFSNLNGNVINFNLGVSDKIKKELMEKKK